MNIYKRKDGRWEGRMSRGKSNNGKRKYKAVFGKTKEEVSKKMTKIRRIESKSCSITVSQLYSEWHGSIKHRIKESTEANYSLKVNKHILPAFGAKLVDSIQGSDIYSFIESKC